MYSGAADAHQQEQMMTILDKTIGRFAESRKRRLGMRAVAQLPDYLLSDVGFTRNWRGELQKLPEGYLR